MSQLEVATAEVTLTSSAVVTSCILYATWSVVTCGASLVRFWCVLSLKEPTATNNVVFLIFLTHEIGRLAKTRGRSRQSWLPNIESDYVL